MYRSYEYHKTLSRPVLITLIVVLGIGTWIPDFFFGFSQAGNTVGGLLYNLIHPCWAPAELAAKIVSFVLAGGFATLLFFFSRRHQLYQQVTILPIFFFLFLTGLFLKEQYLSPGIYALIFILLAFDKISNQHNDQEQVWQSLDMGLFMALATLFSPTSIFYLLLAWIGMLIYQNFTISNFFASLFGFFTPYLLCFGGLFLTNQSALIEQQVNSWGQLFIPNFGHSLHEWVLLGIMLLVALIIFVHFLQYRNNRTHTRWALSACFLFMFGSFIMSGLYANDNHIFTLAYFSSLCFPHYFTAVNSKFSKFFFGAILVALLFTYGTQFFL